MGSLPPVPGGGRRHEKLQAACTTWADDGLKVKTDTQRIRAKRESYLRMYLSDHNAYCEAPCSHACPTHIDIPAYLAALAAGDAAGAAAIVRAELPFPGILGRICPRYCEPVCRRGDVDEPIAICALHRALGDHGPSPAAHAPRPTVQRQARGSGGRRTGRTIRGLVPDRARTPGDRLRRPGQAGRTAALQHPRVQAA